MKFSVLIFWIFVDIDCNVELVNVLCSSLCPLPLVLPLGTSVKSLYKGLQRALSFLHPGKDSVFFQNKIHVDGYCSWLKLGMIINKYVKAVTWNERSLVRAWGRWGTLLPVTSAFGLLQLPKLFQKLHKQSHWWCIQHYACFTTS